MLRCLFSVCALSIVTLLVPASASAQARGQAPAPAAAASTDRTIAVTYKGKGVVDATHDIIVFAFDHAEVNANSRPLDHKYVQKNGGTATFSGLADPVYFFVVYDEKGDYDGQSGPPPAGTPMALYSGPKGEPLQVKPGGKVKMTFTDAKRWK